MEINESKKDDSIGKAIFGALGVLTGAGLIYTTYKLAQENNKLVNDYNDLAERSNRLCEFINDHDFYEKSGINYTTDSHGVSMIDKKPKHCMTNSSSKNDNKYKFVYTKSGIKFERKIVDCGDHKEEILIDPISGLSVHKCYGEKQA